MSQVRANSITNAAGTGAPDFPNGLTSAAGASLASPTFTGAASFPDGSAAAPSITNTGDTNTGIFFPADDTVAITANGATRFQVGPNGQIGVGVGAVSYGTGGQVMISQGDTLAATWGPVPAPTTAQVGTATAGLAVGAVGSYAFLGRTASGAITAGTTYAGSVLKYASLGAASTYNGNPTTATAGGTTAASPAGTWMAMGAGSSNLFYATVMLRIS